MLEKLFQSLYESGSIGTIYNTVVPRRREIHHLAYGDFPIDDHGPVYCLVDTEDSYFWVVDDGRCPQPAISAQTGDCEG